MKIVIKTIYLAFSVALLTQMCVFAADMQSVVSNQTKDLDQPKDLNQTAACENHQPSHRHATGVSTVQKNSTVKHANGWVWAGAGFLFVPEELTDYISHPTMNYQFGVAKSFHNFSPYSFFYLGFIFDIAYSQITPCAENSFTALNEQWLIGYEGGSPHFSVFLETGPVMQHRSLIIEKNEGGAAAFGTQPGISVNAGFNIKMAPQRRSNHFLFRVGMNFMYGGSITLTPACLCDDESININPISYGPSLSFGVRL